MGNNVTDMGLSPEVHKSRIAELIAIERTARDMATWDRMLSAYSPDSYVDISWYQGSGAGFVAASEQHYDTGARSLHQLGPSLIEIQGDRAIADTGCAVIIPTLVHGKDVTVISYARMRNRLKLTERCWLIAGLRVIYQHDMFIPANPSETIAIDGEKLASFRPSYRSLSYIQYASGLAHYSPRNDLPGVDLPDTVANMVKIETTWLNE